MPTNSGTVQFSYLTRKTDDGEGIEVFVSGEWVKVLPGQNLLLTIGTTVEVNNYDAY